MSAALTLTREELQSLTGLKQPKRMGEWLTENGWIFAPSNDFPKVDRAYSERMLAPGWDPAKGEARRRARAEYVSPAQHAQRIRLSAERDEREAEDARSRAEFEASAPERNALSLEAHQALVRHHSAKRRSLRMQRTPAWADMDQIRAVYDEALRLTAETGIPHHVDHEIPLQGELVSGLHVHRNLQVLTASENSKKRNKFEIEP